MWNWKQMHEDKEILCYCDIDSIADPDEDENGVYRPAECCQPISTKAVAWMSFYIKSKEAVKQYIDQRECMGLPTDGYQDFNNVLCVVEIDSEKRLYRVIPTMDYDINGNGLGQSAALDEAGRTLFKGAMKGNWSPIQARKTHKAIHALFKFIFG